MQISIQDSRTKLSFPWEMCTQLYCLLAVIRPSLQFWNLFFLLDYSTVLVTFVPHLLSASCPGTRLEKSSHSHVVRPSHLEFVITSLSRPNMSRQLCHVSLFTFPLCYQVGSTSFSCTLSVCGGNTCRRELYKLRHGFHLAPYSC